MTCGGGETAQYRFVYQADGTLPLIQIRDWAASPTTAWNTTGLPGGKYNIIVYIRSAGSINFQSSQRGVYSLGGSCSTAGLSASPTGLVTPGTSVSLTGTSTCTGGGTAEYRFVYKGSLQSTYTQIRDYGPSTVAWNTTGLPADSYDVIVYTRAIGNSSTFEGSAHVTVQIGTQICSPVSISTSPASPRANGSTVMLTGSSSCTGGGTPQYQFYYQAPGSGVWTLIRTWGAASVSWVTPATPSGTYSVQVQARHVGSSGPAESSASTSYQLGAVCNSVTLAASPTSPRPVGTIVTLTGSATCTSGGVPQYRYSYSAPGTSTFVLILDWSALATTTWNTGSLTPGLYNLRVETRANGNTSGNEAVGYRAYTLANLSITDARASVNFHTCGVVSDGTARCWGLNSFGQIGDGTTVNRTLPTAVSGLTGVSAVAPGGFHSCALLTGGTVRCWGRNSDGQLGNGTTTDSAVPVAVTGLTSVTAIASGTYHTCALRSTGAVVCWGDGAFGELGRNSNLDQNTAQPVMGFAGATAITAGGFHTCALVGSTVQCTGNNEFGQLGNGTTTRAFLPVTVSGLSNASMVAAGDSHTCAKLTTGGAKCWGFNQYGQLGDGSTTNSSLPVIVNMLSNVNTISPGYAHTCAQLTTGRVACWGNNDFGQLGDGTTTEQHTFVLASGVTAATTVSAGGVHTCAMLSGNAAQCWGYNGDGQLGDGSTTNRLTPGSVTFPP